MKKEEIVAILKELYKVSGFRISLHGMNFEELAAYPESALPLCAHIQCLRGELANCKGEDALFGRRVRESDGTVIYKCRFGLTDVICPLHSLGSPAGYLMMGQLRDEDFDTEGLVRELCARGSDADEARRLIENTPVMSREKTDSFAKIMTICAEYLTLINALPGNKPSTAELTRLYVYENFRERISMSDICRALGRTKSVICPAFKERYGMTVIEYLTELRLEEAKRMLTETDMTVTEIADAIGFSDSSYFTKVFTKHEGRAPTSYRWRKQE